MAAAAALMVGFWFCSGVILAENIKWRFWDYHFFTTFLWCTNAVNVNQ